MTKLYEYNTCCLHSTAELIHQMRDWATPVDYAMMRNNCEGLLDWAVSMGYFRHPNSGLTLANDWHVSYGKSFYDGRPCFYLVHSAIEYIWTIKCGMWKGDRI